MQYFTSKRFSIKAIFLHNDNWKRFFVKNAHRIRNSIITNVAKLLLCHSLLTGYKLLQCPCCGENKKIPFSCHSKSCSSCGKKATDIWIKKNYSILPKTSWQNITFTLPKEIQLLLWYNRHLINIIPKLAANITMKLAASKKVYVGIFLASHTFGRDLKRNFHLHMATTCGGLTFDHKHWKKLYFHHETIKTQWRYAIVTLLRQQYKNSELILPNNLSHIKDYTDFNCWINFLFQKNWVVHLSKPTINHKQNIEYLGRYLKRPPLSEANILDYDGEFVWLRHLDRHTNSYTTIKLDVFEFIARFITHIPDRHFKGIRYYGWLANRVRAKKLPIVYAVLKNEVAANQSCKNISWKSLLIKEFQFNPLRCECGDYFVVIGACFDSLLKEFIYKHHNIIKLKCA